MEFHQPVLADSVIQNLNIIPGSNYIDATVGNGGHSIKILEMGGIVYGLDQDPTNLKIATDRIYSQGYKNTFFPINTNFINLEKLIGDTIPSNIKGVVFDLGLSVGQQKSIGRGFSFNDFESLDMRLDPNSQNLTAEEVINTYSFQQLYDIFTKLAQEKFSKPLILRIISNRQQKPIKDSQRLADIIRDYYQKKHIKTNIDPSTKILMALRIFVNNELINLKYTLNSTITVLPPDCHVVIISFHSGEDRLVKQFIRQYSILNKITPLTTKPIIASTREIINNPLSRSAILRSYKIN